MAEKKEKKSLFTKKSLDRLNSPEQLNDYLKVTKPSIWLVFFAAALLLAGVIAWACFAEFESYVSGTAVEVDGILIIHFDEGVNTSTVHEGMSVEVGEIKTEITSTGVDDDGRFFAFAEANIPDGRYDVKVTYKRTQVIKLLFN